MSNIEKPRFVVLDVTGNNYLAWRLDLEMHLQSMDLAHTVIEGENASDKDKASALIFIRRHLHESLKSQYLSVRDPYSLWKRLKDRYDHTKMVILPQTRNDWQNLRLQDYKSVSDYNSALYDIVSRFELCGIKLTEEELLEKTFSTFHHTNILLQQQYRQRNFTTYSDLISVLLTAEKNDQLLLKNNNIRPAGSIAVPEVHAVVPEAHGNNNRNQFRGRGRGRGRGHGRQNNRPGRGRHGPNNNRGNDRGRRQVNVVDRNTCRDCGMKGHWSRTCRTPKHLVALYKASLENNDRRGESNAIAIVPTDGDMIEMIENNNIYIQEACIAPEVANASFNASDFV